MLTMKRDGLLLMLLLCSTITLLASPNYPKVTTHTLSNGMTVWLNENHNLPKVDGAVVVKAGAMDSPNSGIAHYLEHMLFKGTEKIGAKDYAQEKLYMDSIIALYDALQLLETASQIDSIQKEINRLSMAQSALVVRSEFDHLIARYGGSGVNAFTSYDMTVYYNTFVPEYMAQWAEINSERLINPVFRLFQSELETVYEEKNMYADNIYSQAMDKILSLYFAGTPYQYPIIGGSDELKKPNLNAMIQFYNTYYVGNNMGIMLSGDFDTAEVLPLLEASFGRIPAGEVKPQQPIQLTPFQGREEATIKISIPIVKAWGRLYRGASPEADDRLAMDLACLLLNNENGTGYLDQLVLDNKLLMALAGHFEINNQGHLLAVGAIPKLVVQSEKSAEKLVMQQVERIKQGDFPDAMFEAVKNQAIRNQLLELETTDGVLGTMMDQFGKGLTWDNYLDDLNALSAIRKEQVVAAANRYFASDYLYLSKKSGKYPLDRIAKPNIEPIPNHSDNQSYSAYFDSLAKHEPATPEVRYLEFSNYEPYPIEALETSLFYHPIAVNGIFQFTWRFEVGNRKEQKLDAMSNFISLLGTDSLTFQTLNSELQRLGSVMAFNSSHDYFTIHVEGFDAHFKETMQLLNHFIQQVQPDKQMMKQIVSGVQMEELSFGKDADYIAAAMIEKVKFGSESPYLKRITSKELRQMKPQRLVDLFHQALRYPSTMHYSGSMDRAMVASLLEQTLSSDGVKHASASYEPVRYQPYEKPIVYFFDIPKSRQSTIYAYQLTNDTITQAERSLWRLMNHYWGGDMKSVLFQEIRELRSMAYSTRSRFLMNVPKYQGEKGVMLSLLSTQNDKTIDEIGRAHV